MPPQAYYSMFPSMQINTTPFSGATKCRHEKIHNENNNENKNEKKHEKKNGSKYEFHRQSPPQNQARSVKAASINAKTKNEAYVMLMFYKPIKEDPWINRLVAWVDKPFSHVEIAFEDGLASSIFAGETVFCKQRTFSNPQYASYTITVSNEQVKLLKLFCQRASNLGIHFDKVGMYGVHLPGTLCNAIKSFGTLFSKHGPGMHTQDGMGCAETTKENQKYGKQNKYRQLQRNTYHAIQMKEADVDSYQIAAKNDMSCFSLDDESYEQSCNAHKDTAILDEKLTRVLSQMHREGVFCSKYIISALQFAQVDGFMHMDAGRSSPSKLYHTVVEHGCNNTFGGLIIAAHPFRQKLLNTSSIVM
jgi:hypothetical protein